MDLIIRRKRGNGVQDSGLEGRALISCRSPRLTLRMRWGREEGSSAQCDTGLRTPAGRFPIEKSTFVLEKDKERTLVLAPGFSALTVKPDFPGVESENAHFSQDEPAWLTWGLHVRRGTPLPSPTISEMHTSESFSKLETRPEKQQTKVTD